MTKGWKIAAIAVVVGVVTYVGLEFLLPHHKVEVKLGGLVSADSVFDSKLKSPDEVAAATATTPGAATDDTHAAAPSESAVAGDDAMAIPPDDSADQSALTDTVAANDDAGANNVDTTTAADDSEAAVAETAPPSPSPAPAAAAAAPTKAAVAKPSTQPGKAVANKPAEKKALAAVAGTPTPWWTSSGNGKGLQVIYVGSAAFERAIVVMGNAPFANTGSASQNIHVSDASGKAVAGSWKLGNNNKSMLVFPVSKSGRFQVSVGAGLSDAQNRKLGQSVKGPIVVQ